MTQTQRTEPGPAAPPELDGGGALRERRGRRPARVWIVSAAVLLAAGGVATWLLTRDSGSDGSTASAKPATALERVTRRDLVETDTESGTLGYTDSRPVTFAQPGIAAPGSGGSKAPSGDGNASPADYRPPASADGVASATPVAYELTPADQEPGSTDGATTGEVPGALSVAPQGAGSGAITGTDASGQTVLDCAWDGASASGDCTEPLSAGTYTLHATAASGSALTSWTRCPGTISPDGMTCAFAVDDPAQDVMIAPVFAKSSAGGGAASSGSSGNQQPSGSHNGEGSPDGSGSSPSASAPSSSGSSPASGSADSSPSSPSSTGANVVTWLPHEGDVVRRGQILFRVNGKASFLLYGDVPAWRTLKLGVADGADVRELEQNLVGLGLDPGHDITVDDHFGAATAKAVERWQKRLGAAQTGRVRLGTVVFLPGARRIGTLQTQVGAELQAGAKVMDTTSIRQDVTVALDTAQQTIVARGDAVTVTLPSGQEVPGRISDVGKVAESDSSDTPGAQGDSSSGSTITVTIELDGGSGIDLDQAPVDVDFAQETRKNVLSVPVTALLSLLGGGYAVEVADGSGSTHVVGVTPGLYAGGYVEISGDGIEEGARVVVPQ